MFAALKRIFQWFCWHSFSWPHSGTQGQDYQVCLRCGVMYGYDINTMRRTKRLDLHADALNRPQ